MKCSWAVGLGLVLSMLAGEAFAGPPQSAVLSRTALIRGQDDLAPQDPPALKRVMAGPPMTDNRLVPVAFSSPPVPAQTPAAPGSPGHVLPEGTQPQGGTPVGGGPYAEEGNHEPTLYVSGQYLLWSIRDSRFPFLASTGPFRLTPPGDNSPFTGSGGVLGQPGTRILFGGGDVPNEERSGGRFTVGGWLPYDCGLGFEVGGVFLGRRPPRLPLPRG